MSRIEAHELLVTADVLPTVARELVREAIAASAPAAEHLSPEDILPARIDVVEIRVTGGLFSDVLYVKSFGSAFVAALVMVVSNFLINAVLF